MLRLLLHLSAFFKNFKGMFCVHIHVHWEPTIGAFAPTGTCLLLYQAKLNPRVNHGQMRCQCYNDNCSMKKFSELTMGIVIQQCPSLRPSLASSLVQSLVLLSRLLLNSAERALGELTLLFFFPSTVFFQIPFSQNHEHIPLRIASTTLCSCRKYH